MELAEAITARRSIRAFVPDPIPREKIVRMVELARWAPSWGNTQPWEIVVADGEKTKALTEALLTEAIKRTDPTPDIPIPSVFPSIHKGRYVTLGKTLFTKIGIAREDKQARIEHNLNNYRLFGAPAAIYLTIDGELNEPYSCLDVGSIGTTLCYAAVQEGLGTIFLSVSIHYPHIVKKILGIPETKKLVIGIAIGTPHPDAPASLFRSERDPAEQIMRFV